MDAHENIVFDRIIDWIKSGKLRLPAYSPTTLKILGRNSFETDIAGLEKIILADQVLAVEVLRTANSPFYCAVSHITTIRNAIVRLGVEIVKRIVVMVSERTRYRSWFPDLNNMLVRLWMHVSTTAMSAQWLSQRLRMTGLQDVCFLGGLLHDIGKLAIICAIDEMRKSRNLEETMSSEAIHEFMTDNHCQIGYEIMKRWEIPDVYCKIARDHHNEEFAAEDLSMMIVRVADKGSALIDDNREAPTLSEIPEAQALHIEETILLELQKILGIHKANTA